MTQDLRDKDITVLQAIQNGASDVKEIRENTGLTNREINYSLCERSLEEQGLVEVIRRDGREWSEINGHEKNTWKAKEVHLSDQGIQTLVESPTEDARKYENLSQEEIFQQVQELEERLDRLENLFKDFRRKVMERY